MTLTKAALGTVVGLQASALAINNANYASRALRIRPQRKPDFRKMNKNMIRVGVGTLIGVSLLAPTADIIAGID